MKTEPKEPTELTDPILASEPTVQTHIIWLFLRGNP